MVEITDEMFAKYAQKSEREAQRNDFAPRNFVEIKWTGCKTNEPTIIRVVGGPPDAKDLGNYTAKTVNIAWIVGDDGKKFKLIRPNMNEDAGYLINKIISAVTKPKWVNGTKTFPVQEQYPDIYNLVTKNGLADTDPRAKFDKGWKGKEVLIINVIDRAQMDWHRENKHTMLLAKSVNEGNDGSIYADEGISKYVVQPKFNHLFMSYGSWENYDIAITKTGNMNEPYIIVNATHSPREIKQEYQKYISTDDSLTDEEKSWEKYDLETLYHVTSMTKIKNRLKGAIKKIDYALGTHFFEELETLAEKERLEMEAKRAEEEADGIIHGTANSFNSYNSASVAPVQSQATPATRKVAQPVQTAPAVKLPYQDELPAEFQSMIKSVKKNADGTFDVDWDVANPAEDLALCPECGLPAPQNVPFCPKCHLQFE